MSQVRCSPVGESAEPVSDEEISVLHPLVPSWKFVLEEGHRKLRGHFVFDDERSAQDFVRRLETIAVKEDHPVEWKSHGRAVEVTAWTPAVGGVHPNDFVLAGKADGAFTFVVVGHPGETFSDEPLPRLWDLPLFHSLKSKRFADEKHPDNRVA